MKCPFFATCHYSTMVSCCIVSWIQPDNCGCQPRENLWNNSHSKSLEKFKTTLILMQPTLTCQIIMQQVLLFFWKKTTYTTLLGPTLLSISDIFPSKPDFHLHKWEKKSFLHSLIKTYTFINFREICHLQD